MAEWRPGGRWQSPWGRRDYQREDRGHLAGAAVVTSAISLRAHGNHFRSAGIQGRLHYNPPHRHSTIVQGCPQPTPFAPTFALSLPLSPMTALPSFVELMATLGLGDDAPEPSKLSAAHHHSRSSSHSSTTSAFSASSSNVSTASCNIYSLQHKHSSPAIVVSSLDGSDSEMPADIRRSRANTRYSPYGSIVSPPHALPLHLPHCLQSHSRKASMPILNGELNREGPVRVSPRF